MGGEQGKMEPRLQVFFKLETLNRADQISQICLLIASGAFFCTKLLHIELLPSS
jgi:hypothetical protein